MPKPFEARDIVAQEQQVLQAGNIAELNLPPQLADPELLEGYAPALALSALEWSYRQYILRGKRQGQIGQLSERASRIFKEITQQTFCDPTFGTGIDPSEVIVALEEINADS